MVQMLWRDVEGVDKPVSRREKAAPVEEPL
jgi:hypothetical protein